MQKMVDTTLVGLLMASGGVITDCSNHLEFHVFLGLLKNLEMDSRLRSWSIMRRHIWSDLHQ